MARLTHHCLKINSLVAEAKLNIERKSQFEHIA